MNQDAPGADDLEKDPGLINDPLRSSCSRCRCGRYQWDGDEQGPPRCNNRFSGVAGGQVCGHLKSEHIFFFIGFVSPEEVKDA